MTLSDFRDVNKDTYHTFLVRNVKQSLTTNPNHNNCHVMVQ